MDIIKLIRNIEKYILIAVGSLFVIFVLPRFPSAFAVPKEIFAAIAVSLVLILWSARSIYKGEASFFIGKFDLAVILLMLAYILAAIFRTPNKMEAFFYPGTATFIIISALFYYLVNQFDKKTKDSLLIALFASGILLSLTALFTKLGLFAKIPQLPSFMKDAAFNPVGGNLPSVLYLVTLLPIGAAMILKEKDAAKKIFFGVASGVLIFGAVILAADLLPGKSQALTFPSLQTSWEVVVESLKQSPIWGAGSDNYISAFNLYRPLAYNQTTLWMTRFSVADNYYFTLITELGFAGLAAIVILLISVYKALKVDIKERKWEELSVAFILILFAVFPSAPTLIFLLLSLLAVFSRSEEKSISLATTRVPVIIIALPVFLGIAALAIFGTKAVGAEITYKKAFDALSKNNAKDTYNLMVQAVNQDPYVDRYHASLAQVDMALATSIASNNKNLTDTDRQSITQLVQESINQGKATVTLNSGRSGNWEVLAQIYRSIMSFAQGSDQYTIQTYTQAVALDPINPNLRIALGGTYYALGRYDDAIDAYKLAVLTKPDYANSHYNLAIAYRDKKDYDNAIAEMNTVLGLVTKDSADYNLAKSTLDDLQKSKPAVTTTNNTGGLTTPQKQTTVVQPPITLPQEATPPATTQ